MSRKDRKERSSRGASRARAGRAAPAAPSPQAGSDAARADPRSAFSIRTLCIVAALIAITVLVFAPVRHYNFVQLDDPVQVSENAQVAGGLTWAGAAWAFTSAHAGYWMPLVWLSHMLDVQLYGMNAGPHHVTNLVLHLACTLLLFGLLLRMTGAACRSAFVAALFAVHPLHVESVAWITERKDVLSTLFWMLTMWAYVAYVRRPGRTRYLLAAVSFALGLMAKPMLVTLPFVLLLLDVWPLGRLRRREAGGGRREADGGRREADGGRREADGGRREATAGLKPRPTAEERAPGRPAPVGQGFSLAALVLEKLPLIALAVVAGIVVFVTQRGAGAVGDLQVFPFSLRLQNALVTYIAYLGKMLWPARLVAFYPYPDSLPAWSVAGSALLLVAISFVVVRAARRFPYLAVGWLWYLVTLVPVIGVVQVGIQSMADRFTYVPLIGIFIMIAWGVPDFLVRWRVPGREIPVAAAAAAVIIACTVTARTQVTYWQDSVAMWTHTTEIAMNTDAYHAHMALGTTLRAQGRIAEALGHFTEAVHLKPDSPDAQYNLGATLAGQGKEEEAIARLSDAVRLRPGFVEAHVDLALLLSRRQKTDEAIAHYEQALRVRPDLAEVQNNLGALLSEQGKIDESIRHFSEAVRLKPDLELAHVNLGISLVKANRLDEAVREFREALRINPANEFARRAVDGFSRR